MQLKATNTARHTQPLSTIDPNGYTGNCFDILKRDNILFIPLNV
jgi:hypothetical protein